MKSAIFSTVGENVYMCYDYVHLDNLSDISAYRNHNEFLCPVPNRLHSRGVSPCIVTHLQALLYCETQWPNACDVIFMNSIPTNEDVCKLLIDCSAGSGLISASYVIQWVTSRLFNRDLTRLVHRIGSLEAVVLPLTLACCYIQV